jgi:hypothetical protein
LTQKHIESSFRWFVTIPFSLLQRKLATIFSKLGQHIVIHDPKRNNTSEGTPKRLLEMVPDTHPYDKTSNTLHPGKLDFSLRIGASSPTAHLMKQNAHPAQVKIL